MRSASSAVISSTVSREDLIEDACNSEDSTALSSKKRRFNSNLVEGHMWLKHEQDNSMTFCEWCRYFVRNEQQQDRAQPESEADSSDSESDLDSFP